MKRMWSLKQIKDFIKGTTKDISTLVDAQGHERFIEGDITMETIEGITQTYGKWSLSGTHLMIVLAGSIANTTALSWGTLIANVDTLPEWIINKIVPLSTFYVDVVATQFFKDDLAVQTTNALLRKNSNKISIALAALTANADRTFRIVFDLLIDNE